MQITACECQTAKLVRYKHKIPNARRPNKTDVQKKSFEIDYHPII